MNYSTNKQKWIILFIFLTCCLLSVPAVGRNKPTKLMTDLLDHTAYVYKDGLLTNLSLQQVDDNEKYQFAKIRSAMPTFSWIVPGNGQGIKQKSYQIILTDSPQSIENLKPPVWDSKNVDSDNSISVPYSGEKLIPNKIYYWKVKVVTSEGESDWSDPKPFRTAEELSDYEVSHYPLIKEIEDCQSIEKINPRNTFVDFGRAAFGSLKITLTSNAENDTVLIHLGEHASNNRVDRKPPGTIRYCKYIQPLQKGTHTYHLQIAKDGRNTGSAAILIPDYVGEVFPFRYCEVEEYNGEISKNDILRESVYYPFDDSMSFFKCSNDTLNQIWDLCKYSIKATSFAGIYVDGDRERIPYEADALINQLCHYGVDREYSMARRSHEHLLRHPTWPTEWIIQAVLIAWYDYLYTGDPRSLKANYDILKKRTLQDLTEKNGLISTTTGLLTQDMLSSIHFEGQVKDIVDWPHTGILGLNKLEGGEADGFVFTDYNVVVNAYHYEALKTMANIAKALDLPHDEKKYKAAAETFKGVFFKSFFNTQKGYFTDGIDTDHSSLHGNMFAIAFDMVPNKNKKTVLDFIKSRGMACSVYGSQFLMDAIYDVGDAQYGLDMLTKTDDRGWYNMIRVGSTISLEAWDNKYKPNQDWNHAWGATPANIIPRKLIGIEPLSPGFSLARLKPQIDKLSWAKAKVPTIRGVVDIEISNERGEYEMKVSIPANMEFEVYLPLLSQKYNITHNERPMKGTPLKNKSFISIGKIASGNHIFTMEY